MQTLPKYQQNWPTLESVKRLKNTLQDNDICLSFTFGYIKTIIENLSKAKNKTEALNKKILSEITPLVSECILSGQKNIQLSVDKIRKPVDHTVWKVW